MSHHYEPTKPSGNPGQSGTKEKGRQFHRTWWFWLAVVLMLGAMLIYGLL